MQLCTAQAVFQIDISYFQYITDHPLLINAIKDWYFAGTVKCNHLPTANHL